MSVKLRLSVRYFVFLLFLSFLFFLCSRPPASQITVYVGTGAEGIYIYQFDSFKGELKYITKKTDVIKPGFLTISSDGKNLYCTNNNPEFLKENYGGVSSYKINPKTGELAFLNQQSSHGSGPCYVSMNRDGNFVQVVNYDEGTIAVYPVLKDGHLGEASDVVCHQGASIDPERQTSPHPHFIQVDPDNRFVLVNDLGVDKVFIYQLDKSSGKLVSSQTPYIKMEPGSGPRHLDFHPNQKFVYIMNELGGSVSVYDYPFSDSMQTAIQTISSLPGTFQGFNKSADIHIHPSGKFLYCSNRGDFDSITIYRIDQDTGFLILQGFQKKHIHWPRNFAIDPSGNFILAGNMSEDHIAVFKINPETGMLSFLNKSSKVPRPSCIQFMKNP